jgi:hypothetical protein
MYIEGLMTSNVLLNPFANNSKNTPISQRFFRAKDGWYVNHDGSAHGPYPDKATAQTALMCFSVGTIWPTEKELRQFIHLGR